MAIDILQHAGIRYCSVCAHSRIGKRILPRRVAYATDLIFSLICATKFRFLSTDRILYRDVARKFGTPDFSATYVCECPLIPKLSLCSSSSTVILLPAVIVLIFHSIYLSFTDYIVSVRTLSIRAILLHLSNLMGKLEQSRNY